MRPLLIAGNLIVASICCAHAQSPSLESCRGIISESLLEYGIRPDSNDNLNVVFDRYCDTSGILRARDLGPLTDIIVKNIPFRYSEYNISPEDSLMSFCRSYQSVASIPRRDNYREKIIKKSYESADACAAFSQSGVTARHEVLGSNLVNFNMFLNRDAPARVTGILKTSNIVCKANYGSAIRGVEAGESFRVELAKGDILNLSCFRNGDKDLGGNIHFEDGVISVQTDVLPVNSYSIFLPGETRVAENKASIIQGQLSELAEESRRLKSAVEGFRNASGVYAIRGTAPAVADSYGSVPGLSGTYSPNPQFVVCPPGSFISAIQGFKAGQFISEIRYFCTKLP